ncbi:MAG: glycosyltransferase [Candidatus Ancillula sp.]|nr:glycosyltransferase [Candidatus Ancillula sp.]
MDVQDNSSRFQRVPKFKVLLAAGGTAGHIKPAICVANELKGRGVDAVFLGSNGLEEKLVPTSGYKLFKVRKTPVVRSLKQIAKNLTLPLRFFSVVKDVEKILVDENIQVVVGFGGYIAAPAYIAASRRKIPVVVHEQNAKVGLANILGAKICNYFAYTFHYTKLPRSLRAKMDVAECTGLPVAVLSRSSQKDTSNDKLPQLLVFGGSLGAVSINRAVIEALDELLDNASVVHITGYEKAEEALEYREQLVKSNPEKALKYQVLEYSDNISELMQDADLVIARSGAGTVHELAIMQKASVLVPLPIGNGEQHLNARLLGSGTIIVDDSEFNANFIKSEVIELLKGQEKLAQMSNAAAKNANADGAKLLAKKIDQILAKKLLNDCKNVHFMAISGAGIAPIATCFSLLSKVTGCDSATGGHSPKHIVDVNGSPKVDALVYSSAIKRENLELNKAIELYKSNSGKFHVFHRSDALELLLNAHDISITVAGSHGKTTVTSMLASIFFNANSSFIIGAEAQICKENTNGGYLDKSMHIVVAEADESDGSFIKYHSDVAIITSIEADHLDFYKNFDNICNTFRRYAANSKDVVVTPEVQDILQLPRENLHIIDSTCAVNLQVPGEYNRVNARLALLASGIVGARENEARTALSEFQGAQRRFQVHELNFNGKSIEVVDDYAHHPTEIRVLLDAALEKYPDKQIIALFQPHLFSRTLNFAEEFAQQLGRMDVPIVTKIYPAREIQEDFPDVSPNTIAQYNSKIFTTNTLESGVKMALDEAKKSSKGAVILSVGAGPSLIDIFKKVVGV